MREILHICVSLFLFEKYGKIQPRLALLSDSDFKRKYLHTSMELRTQSYAPLLGNKPPLPPGTERVTSVRTCIPHNRSWLWMDEYSRIWTSGWCVLGVPCLELNSETSMRLIWIQTGVWRVKVMVSSPYPGSFYPTRSGPGRLLFAHWRNSHRLDSYRKISLVGQITAPCGHFRSVLGGCLSPLFPWAAVLIWIGLPHPRN